MTDTGHPTAAGPDASPRLGLLLAMAMFVLVVDTSLMNVSISAVVEDLDTTVSGVQSAIALEALVSAAFILISSKIGDLIGRRRAYVLGLVAYAIGALAMTLAQNLIAIIVFWAIIGGIGASLLLPAMQSLIHGNFEGKARTRAYALVGASAAIAAAVGPLLGGFITTFLSWRVGFLLEAVIIAVVLAGIGLVKDVPYHGDRSVDLVGAALSIIGMGGVVTGILVWQEGGGYVGVIIGLGVMALGALVWWLRRRKARGKATLLDPTLFDGCQVVVTQQVVNQRVAPAPMETRAAAAVWGADGRLTTWVPNQGAQLSKLVIAGMLGVGGGIVVVPILDLALGFLGVDPAIRMQVAVATSLATIIPTSISSSRAHRAKGAVDGDLVRRP